jgi:phosphoribosylformimino-5-aminoimidazole carboxamide ribotide isomerase
MTSKPFIVLPAIDLIGGQVVRLRQGNYQESTVYPGSPLALAQEWEAAGLTHLHLVDLDGAKAGHVVNLETLRAITAQTKLQVDFGGGLRSNADLDPVLGSGAKQITAGSLAVKNPDLVNEWIKTHGPERIILGVDIRDGWVAVSGWQDTSKIWWEDFVNSWFETGLRTVICTDIARDGMMEGPAFDLYETMLRYFPEMKLIASGGVSSITDIQELDRQGLYGAIIGKAIHEGIVTAEELAKCHRPPTSSDAG